jgi:hypothetical protein
MGALSARQQVLVLNRAEICLKRSEMPDLPVEAVSGERCPGYVRNPPWCRSPRAATGGIRPGLNP